MINSVSTLLVFIFVISFSVLIANLGSTIFTDDETFQKLKTDASYQNKDVSTNTNNLVIDEAENHIMWFIQISDLHLSIFEDQTRITDFRNFVKNTIEVIRPKVVLASGDLTDGKDNNKLGSRTYEKEWKIYSQILNDGNISRKTDWLDIRGNHDFFNVPNVNSPKNFFNKYSIQGPKYKRSYMHQITDGTEKYTFIAVDASLEPGPKRQFHFVGMLTSIDMSDLIEMNKKAVDSNSNFTILFGHYPTSCILSPGGEKGLREIIGRFKNNVAYLCGHYHTQGGFIPRMYTLHKNGFLELELGDWKKNRLFRVAAFDHGLFSFVDCNHNEWPIVLVTNPKNALFNIPVKENVETQKNSKFIRILIFSVSKIKSCRVKFNPNSNWINCIQVSDVLFVVPWNPKNFNKGLQNLFIYVKTSDGKVKFVKHPFSLDGTRSSFDLLANIILTVDITQVFQTFYGIAVLGCVFPLCIFRILHELVRSGKIKSPRIKYKFIGNIVKRFWILSSIDRLFIPLVLYCVYISVGPWSFLEIVDGYMGTVFVWGYFVNNTFTPGTLTYMYGTFQLTFCQFPLLFIYANKLQTKYQKFSSHKRIIINTRFMFSFISRNFPFVLVILGEITLALIYLWIHGLLAFILCPFRTWSVVYHISLYYIANNIPKDLFESVNKIWS